MSDVPQPTSGSLSAKLIHACTKHTSGKCPLDCKYRVVEDLGQIASFRTLPPPTLPDPTEGMKTGTHPPERGIWKWPPWSRTQEKP